MLLIEAGGSDRRIPVRAPLAYGAQMGGPTDWAFESEPEPGCDGRRIPQPRGKVLGGTSAMNAMVWVRGTRLDYDGWQVPGWGWDDVEPVFRRIEAGPMRVTRVAEPDEVSRRFVAAARAVGVAANDDVSGPDLDGAAISPVTVWKGQRWSTARAYLDPARRLSTFSMVTGALVRRIVIRDGTAVGVEYERRGRSYTAIARREIVLSAGAFGTPQLLQVVRRRAGRASALGRDRSPGRQPAGGSQPHRPPRHVHELGACPRFHRFGRRPQSEMVAALADSPQREADKQPDGGGGAHSVGTGSGGAGLSADPRTDLRADWTR